MPRFGEGIGSKFRQILPSFPEGGLRALMPLTPREAGWAMVGAVLPPLEDPFRQRVVEREVVGIARRIRTLRGGLAAAVLLAGGVPAVAQVPSMTSPAPPTGAGMTVYDAGAAMQRFKDTLSDRVREFWRDNQNYMEYVHNALVALKTYKSARQAYNRIATGTIDIAFIPNIPTVEYELPISGDGSVGQDGVQSGAFTRGRLQFMSMSPSEREKIYGKLPPFRPRINISNSIKSLLSGIDADVDTHSVYYDQDGKPMKVQSPDAIKKAALADATAAWLFSFHQVGIGDILSAPDKIIEFNHSLQSERMNSEMQAERNFYKLVMHQKQIDDAVRMRYPTAGPSNTYKILLKGYKAMQERRRLLGDPNGVIATQIRETNRELLKVEADIQAAAFMRSGPGLATNINVNSKERDKDAAQGDSKTPAKSSAVSVKDVGAATIGSLAGESTPDQAKMAIELKALNREGASQDLMKLLIDMVAGAEVRRQDEQRLAEAERIASAARAVTAQGEMMAEASENLLALHKLDVSGPSFVIWPNQSLTVYGFDADGNPMAVDYQRPPAPPVTVEIDPAGRGMEKVRQIRDQHTMEYMKAEARQTADDLKESLKTASGVFGKDFVSQMYYRLASGFKAIFGLKNFDLTRDAEAMKNAGKPMSEFYKRYYASSGTKK